MAQQFDYPKTETELRKLQDKLYQHSKKVYDEGGRPALKGLLEIMSAEATIITAIHNIKSNRGSETPGVDSKTMRKDYLQKSFSWISSFLFLFCFTGSYVNGHRLGLQSTFLQIPVDLLHAHTGHAQLLHGAAGGIIIGAVNGGGNGDKRTGQRRGQADGLRQRVQECGAVLGVLKDVSILHGQGPLQTAEAVELGKPLLVGQLFHETHRGPDGVTQLMGDGVPLIAEGLDHFQNGGGQALVVKAEVLGGFHSAGV